MSARPLDRTYIAVKRQLLALRVDRFELGIYHRHQDQMRNFVFTTEALLERLNWLKRENTQGHDIYIRPQGSQGLIFFDDLSRAGVERLRRDGFSPAVVVESSPQNFHGWIRVSEEPISESLATAICKQVALIYGADKDSADWRHYGRLAGFTNRKPEHVNEAGSFVFVLLAANNGKLAPNAEALLAAGEAFLAASEAALAREKAHAVEYQDDARARQFFKSYLTNLQAQYGVTMDTSRADWMIVKKMIQQGFRREAVEDALLTHSLAIAKRKGQHAHTYLQVTLDNAFSVFR